MFRKNFWTVVVLAAFLSVGSVVPSQAWDRDDKCEKSIHKAEQNLDKAVRKHGEHSRQAEQKREALERARAKCRGDRDRDHDRDHDRH